MGDLDRIIRKYKGGQIDGRLLAAVSAALAGPVADVVKQALAESARTEVYDKYTPKFYSRRGDGGIANKETMTVSVSGSTLTVTADAGWQHLRGGRYPSERLADALAAGSARYYFDKAGPRPFHEAAKEKVLRSGEAQAALLRGLAAQGIDITQYHFDIS